VTLTCQVCGQRFPSKRSHAKTCSDACRARKSRRARDPGIGSPERRQRQRAGLNQKYAYRQRGQARRGLQRLGLVPSEWVKDSSGEWSPQFKVSEKERERNAWPRTLPAALDLSKRLWSPADSFPQHEVYIGFRDGGRPPPRGWHGRPHWPPVCRIHAYAVPHLPADPIYEQATERRELEMTSGAPFAKSEALSRYGVRSYGPKGEGVRFVESELRASERSQKFTCQHCGATVWSRTVLAHECVSVTRHTRGEREGRPLPRRRKQSSYRGGANG
jgi:hypothetical protein